ncbi:mechanosensitive ion channel family protein [Hydrogenimonas urashimensis]|uniref:mechanosensitive ion channel family protein n=1 Tax=Hydrogenimonas urashimensis TaxID=2740515 RepID=UPI0019164273|nr:mechanosensitive ion channel family protein [Hydrogenimonas urashimensis]
MFELLNKTFYGNTILEWSIAAGGIILSFIIARTLYWLIGHFFKKVTKRTQNRFDDILVDMLEEPIVFVLVITGIWYSLHFLHLSDMAETIVSRAYYVLFIIAAAWLITRLSDATIETYLVPYVRQTEGKLDDQLLPIIRKGIKLSVWSIAIIVALDNAGYDVKAVLASLGIGGLALALAAKDTVANLFGSFTIFVDKPFVVGDRIKVKGYDGFVREVGIRSTRLQTLDGRMVTIPNQFVANESIINVTSEPSRKITMDLGLTYDTTPEKMELAMKTLRDIAASHPNVEDRIVTAFTEFLDSALNIRFIYYIQKGKPVFDTQNDINMQILHRFNELGLEFAFPTHTVYTKTV